MTQTGYTIAQLRRVHAYAKAHPDATFTVPFAPWPGRFTGHEWRRWFHKCLDAKINREQPASRGRKDSRDWFMQQWRASRHLNQPRLVIDWLPPNLKARFAHRLRAHCDDL